MPIEVLMRLVRSAFLLLLLGAPTMHAAGSQNTDGIYRTASVGVFCNSLGAQTMTAVVLHEGKKENGLFMVGVPKESFAYALGLGAGSVLLTLDGYSIPNVMTADRWLRQRPKKDLHYTYCVIKGGKPVILTAQKHLSELESQMPPSAASLDAGANAGGQNAAQNLSIDELERHCLTLINSSRSQNGSGQLSVDSSLSKLARNYAEYMLSHPERYVHPSSSPHIDLEGRSPRQRAQDAGINTEIHENLGRESRTLGNDKFLVEKQHKMMMSEPPGQHNHRTNILDSEARKVGVGIARDGFNLYLVEEFGH